MNTIEETKHTPCHQSFDALLAEIFKKPPDKKPERRNHDRRQNDRDNHHFTTNTLALLIVLVVVIASLTAYIVGSIKCKNIIEHAIMLTDGAR